MTPSASSVPLRTRIAQACDRCRTKKIRCDGLSPSCTPCAEINFGCRKTDRKGRRGLPRGYTESLEAQVQLLENEVRGLTALSEEKDRDIFFLSCGESGALPFGDATLNALSLQPDTEVPVPQGLSPDAICPTPDILQLNTPSTSLSTAQAFVDAILGSLNGAGSSIPIQALRDLVVPVEDPACNIDLVCEQPPTIVLDHLIRIFFRRWAPLYPLLHRQTILRAYYDLRTDSMALENPHLQAQLHLIFSISILSLNSTATQCHAHFERKWVPILDQQRVDVSIPNLQSCILAQIYWMKKGNYGLTLQYRARAVDICRRLELRHREESSSELSILERELRKRAFWSQYVLDCFCSAVTGTRSLMSDEALVPYPCDVDDEDIADTGFLPRLPGEPTQMSSALALFRLSRILHQALARVFQSAPGNKCAAIVAEVSQIADRLVYWRHSLPFHIRDGLDRGSSPALAIMYHYVGALIYQPMLFPAKDIGYPLQRQALSNYFYSIICILQVLDIPKIKLTVPMRQSELVVCSGLAIVWQMATAGNRAVGLNGDNVRLLQSVQRLLALECPVAAVDFRELVRTVLPGTAAKRAFITNPLTQPEQSNGVNGQYAAARHASCVDRRPGNTHLPDSNGSPPLLHGILLSDSSQPTRTPRPSTERGNTVHPDWERLVMDMDSGSSNIFTSIYGGAQPRDAGPFSRVIAECAGASVDSGDAPDPLASFNFRGASPSRADSETPGPRYHCSDDTSSGELEIEPVPRYLDHLGPT